MGIPVGQGTEARGYLKGKIDASCCGRRVCDFWYLVFGLGPIWGLRKFGGDSYAEVPYFWEAKIIFREGGLGVKKYLDGLPAFSKKGPEGFRGDGQNYYIIWPTKKNDFQEDYGMCW